MGASKYLILLPDLIVLFGPRYFSPNVPSGRNNVKVVICGKYKNLNKVTKINISLKFLIFDILYSLQLKIEGHAV